MLTRRGFAARMAAGLAASHILSEAGYAQRAMISGKLPADMVWLNANENPLGPPEASIQAMMEVLPSSGRYHYPEVHGFYTALGRSASLQPENILAGSGSSEVLHAAVHAFTAPERPLIVMHPTFELMGDLARDLGRTVVRVPLTRTYAADVRRIAAEAEKARGGLIYICNPNNPTSSITPKADLRWLTENLPSGAILMVDEAYIHFGESPDLESLLPAVRAGRNVIVARTFSKLYGMAGVRAGFACAPKALIDRMKPFRISVLSVIAMRAATAALAESATLVPQRRAINSRIRRELCAWLGERHVPFLEPHANFIMIDCGRDAHEFIAKMPPMGVAVGRPFPPLDHMLRVTIGTEAEMQRFRDVFWRVYRA